MHTLEEIRNKAHAGELEGWEFNAALKIFRKNGYTLPFQHDRLLTELFSINDEYFPYWVEQFEELE